MGIYPYGCAVVAKGPHGTRKTTVLINDFIQAVQAGTMPGPVISNRFKDYRQDMLNCGKCEKCVRTMLGLLAVGAMDKTDAFPVKDVSRELVLKSAQKLQRLG
jgi:hypothetical protein